MKARTLLHDAAMFALLAALIGSPAAMAPLDQAALERLHVEALTVQASMIEFRHRIDAKWPGYEQVSLLSSPMAPETRQPHNVLETVNVH